MYLQVAASLQSRLEDHTEIIQTLHSIIIKSLSSPTTDLKVQNCSTINGNTDDPRFGKRVCVIIITLCK